MKRILIIPDVHGRDFWKDPVYESLNDENIHIVFLGDFTDAYSAEWDLGFDYLQHTIDNLKEIIEIKKRYPDRISLLLGNHDCGYAIGEDICSCRMDRWHRREIGEIFRENRILFQMAEECDVAGRHFVFSHAGILKGWVKSVWGEECENPEFNIVDRLNNAGLADDMNILCRLGDYDSYRGWGGYQYGSPVWSDIRSWTRVTQEDTYGYNIVGHTLLERPLVLEQITDLDCRKACYMDDQGLLRSYDTDEEYVKADGDD